MNQESRKELPFKTLKRILTNECGGSVTEESVQYIKSLLENQLKEICKEVVIQHQEENRLRVFHGLPPKKRFDVTLFKCVSVTGIYPPPELEGMSEVGQIINRETTLPKADERIEVT